MRNNRIGFHRVRTAIGLSVLTVATLAIVGCNDNPMSPTPFPDLITVQQFLDGIEAGTITLGQSVVLEGRNIRDTGSSDEKIFSDGTGEVVVDYPSNSIPALNVRIRIRGTVLSGELDGSCWAAL